MTTQTTEAQLEKFGFVPSIYTAQEEREAGHKHVGQHKGWDIFFSIPNGGICAAIILKGEAVFDFMVGDSPDDWEFHFDYLDGDGVYAHTLKAIDAIEL